MVTWFTNLRNLWEGRIFLFSSEQSLRIGYNLNVMRQSACLVLNPVMVDNYAAFFNCMADGSGIRHYDGPDITLFILAGWGRSFLSVTWPIGVQLEIFFCSGFQLFGTQGSPSSGSLLNLLSPRFLFIRMFIVVIVIYLFVFDYSLTTKRFTSRTEELTKCVFLV